MKDKRASTSVETRLGTILRISKPNATAIWSIASPSNAEPLADCFASAMALSTTAAYSGIWAALRMRLGFVVASRG